MIVRTSEHVQPRIMVRRLGSVSPIIDADVLEGSQLAFAKVLVGGDRYQLAFWNGTVYSRGAGSKAWIEERKPSVLVWSALDPKWRSE